MNLLVTLDANYIPVLRVMLYSLLKNNPGEHFCLYIAHSTLTEEHLASILRGLDSARLALVPVPVDDSALAGAPIEKRYPREMYYRLFAARGGLLHDLYLCDWSKTDVGKFERLVIHPLMALQNAEKFGLNDLERDIIVKHMWPLTRALPRHRESFVVSLADKLCATAEMLHVYKAARVGQRLVFAPAAENA